MVKRVCPFFCYFAIRFSKPSERLAGGRRTQVANGGVLLEIRSLYGYARFSAVFVFYTFV